MFEYPVNHGGYIRVFGGFFCGEIFPIASHHGEWSLNVPFLVVGYVFSKFCVEFTFFIYIIIMKT